MHRLLILFATCLASNVPNSFQLRSERDNNCLVTNYLQKKTCHFSWRINLISLSCLSWKLFYLCIIYTHYWWIVFVKQTFDYSQIMRHECSIRWIPITTNGSMSLLAYILTGIPRKAVRRPVKPLMPRLLIFYWHVAILLASTYINHIRCRYLNNSSSIYCRPIRFCVARECISAIYATLCFNKRSKTMFIERGCYKPKLVSWSRVSLIMFRSTSR